MTQYTKQNEDYRQNVILFCKFILFDKQYCNIHSMIKLRLQIFRNLQFSLRYWSINNQLVHEMKQWANFNPIKEDELWNVFTARQNCWHRFSLKTSCVNKNGDYVLTGPNGRYLGLDLYLLLQLRPYFPYCLFTTIITFING